MAGRENTLNKWLTANESKHVMRIVPNDSTKIVNIL